MTDALFDEANPVNVQLIHLLNTVLNPEAVIAPIAPHSWWSHDYEFGLAVDWRIDGKLQRTTWARLAFESLFTLTTMLERSGTVNA